MIFLNKHGTTKASELIDVIQFFESTILPDLRDPDGLFYKLFLLNIITRKVIKIINF